MNRRPIFLQLTKIHFPVAAVVSILHRISGVVLSLFIPALIYLFGLSIRDAQGYAVVIDLVTSTPGKLIAIFLLWNLAHHFLAGVRFLLLDVDIGITKSASTRSAWMVHAGAAGITLLTLGIVL